MTVVQTGTALVGDVTDVGETAVVVIGSLGGGHSRVVVVTNNRRR